MKKPYMNLFKAILSLAVILGSSTFTNAQSTLNTVPPLNGGNGAQGTTFNLQTTGAIIISSFNAAFQSGTYNVGIWYSTTPISGSPNISTANGWTLIQTTSVTGLSAGLTPTLSNIPLTNPLTLPAGTYGFYIGGTSVNAVYTTWNSSNQDVFTDGTVTIYTGQNIGYGGSAPNPVNHPRQFNGGVVYNMAAPCVAPPTAGTINAPSGVCSGANFSLNVTGSTQGSGLTFQWQSSSNGTTWANIAGATSPSLTTSITAATHYRRIITCSGQSDTTNSVQININAFYQCYCNTTSQFGCVSYGSITNVNSPQAGLANSSGCATSGYTQYPTTTATGTFLTGSTYTLNVTAAGFTNNHLYAWIDFNQNGTFEASEGFQIGQTTNPANSVASVQISIPTTALPGLTGMRIRSEASFYTFGTGNMCGQQFYGETEDYIITISPPPSNDAGIAAIDTPFAPACSTANSVWVTLANSGTDTLQSAAINWTVNGIAQTPLAWTGSIAPFGTSASPVFVGNFNFNIGDNLVVWTSTPNGVVDSLPSNDTATFAIPQLSMNGTYTIDPVAGGATNFTTFAAAMTALNNLGVCGPTVFNVANGTYNELISVNSVPGASSVNTITFQSASGDTAMCKIETALTNATNQGVITYFNGAKNIHFKNMGIYNTSTSSYRNVVYVGQPNTNGNSFVGCRMENVPINSTSTLYALVYKVSNNKGDNWHFEENEMVGGSYGVYWWGPSTTYDDNNSFVNNRVINSYYMGIYAYYQNSCVIDDNYIASNSIFTSGRGIQAYYLNNGFSISNNVIPSIAANNHVWPYYGIFLGFGTGDLNNFGKVHGNVLSNRQGYTPLYSTQSVFVEFANNSMYTQRPGFSYGVFISGGAVNSFYNNIVDHQSTSGNAMYVSPAAAIMNMDNNAYRTLSTSLGFWNGNQSTLSSWQNATGKDANAIDIGSGLLFSDTTFLRVCDTRFNGTGANIAGYTHDFEGDPVVTGAVDIGSDQFMPLAEFGGTDTTALCDGDTLTLTVDYFGNSVSWNNGAATGRTFDVVATGFYTASVSNSCGTATKDFIVMSQESATLPSTFNICADDSGTLDPQVSGGMYNWSTGDNGATIVVNTPGAYSITLTDKYGCESSASTTVTQSVAVSMDDTTKFCEGGAATLEANVQGTYAWSNASTSSTIQVSSPGTFSVTVTDLNNCVSSATTEVVEIMNVVAGYTVTPWYLTQVFTSTSQNADSYFWDFNDGTGATSTAQSPTHIFPWPGGTYNVIHVAINECGTDTFRMEVRADEKTGINTLDEKTSVNVFPNPNNGSFNVQINGTSSDAIQIQLIDLQGRVILDRNIGSVNGVHTENIEVENLSKGIYILKTGNDKQSETTRVVIR